MARKFTTTTRARNLFSLPLLVPRQRRPASESIIPEKSLARNIHRPPGRPRKIVHAHARVHPLYTLEPVTSWLRGSDRAERIQLSSVRKYDQCFGLYDGRLFDGSRRRRRYGPSDHRNVQSSLRSSETRTARVIIGVFFYANYSFWYYFIFFTRRFFAISGEFTSDKSGKLCNTRDTITEYVHCSVYGQCRYRAITVNDSSDDCVSKSGNSPRSRIDIGRRYSKIVLVGSLSFLLSFEN